MRNPVACLALFFALTGTGLGAGRAITGGEVRDRSLAGADFRRRGLGPRDVPRGLRGLPGPPGEPGPPGPVGARGGPPAYVFDRYDATVAASGAVVAGSAELKVTHPATGVYCINLYAGFVLAESTDVADPKIVAAGSVNGGPPCPQGSQVQVAVFARDGTPADGPFFVMLS